MYAVRSECLPNSAGGLDHSFIVSGPATHHHRFPQRRPRRWAFGLQRAQAGQDIVRGPRGSLNERHQIVVASHDSLLVVTTSTFENRPHTQRPSKRQQCGLRRWAEEPGVDRWEGTFPSEEAAQAWAAIDALGRATRLH